MRLHNKKKFVFVFITCFGTLANINIYVLIITNVAEMFSILFDKSYSVIRRKINMEITKKIISPIKTVITLKSKLYSHDDFQLILMRYISIKFKPDLS